MATIRFTPIRFVSARQLILTTPLWGLMATSAGAAEKPKWGLDTVAQQELAAPCDPTFESVARHYPMLQLPQEAIGVPEDVSEFLVKTNGEVTIDITQAATAFFLFGKEGQWTRFGHGNPPDSKRLLDGYLPVVLVPFAFDRVEYQQTLFGWSKDMAPDAPLWAYLGLEMKNPTASAVNVELAYQMVVGKEARPVNTNHWNLALSPGEQRRICFRIPRQSFVSAKKNSGGTGIETVEPAEYDRRLDEVKKTWQALLNRGMKIRVPEQRVNDAYRAWLAYTFLNVDKLGDLFIPHDGTGFYEELYGIIAATYCRMLDAYGYSDKAQTYLNSMLAMVRPDGEFRTDFGVGDNGWLLTALEQHYLFTRDREWLARSAPVLEKMGNWIIARRAKEKETQAPASPNFGLVKCRPSADYPEPDYSYITDTAICMGLEAAARALKIAGNTEAAKRVADEAASYRADISRSMDHAVFEHEGTRLLPVLPVSRGWLVKADYGTRGYYSLFASTILETEFFNTEDIRADLIANSLEKRGGLDAGVATLYQGIDHAFAYGYWQQMLRRSEPKKAILALYASMAYGMSRNTYSGVEVVFDIRAGRNDVMMPHLRSGTQQLRLLRSLLVREDGDRLILAQGVPQHWLKSEQRVEVLDAMTTFGQMSYTFESDVAHGKIIIHLVPPKRNPPKKIQLYVRHPENKPILSVSSDGRPIISFDAGSVTLERVEEKLRLELSYE